MKKVYIRQRRDGYYYVYTSDKGDNRLKRYSKYKHLLTAVSVCKIIFPNREIIYVKKS